MNWASIVDVVVPSPTNLFVFNETYLIKEAPESIFLFENFIYLATVTPSFVIFGSEYALSIITFFPFGPKVTLTALLNNVHPFSIY